jgi:3-hydroxybutyryl-CoA dehydrogenase
MGARVALRGAQRGCETIVVARSVERARASLEAAADEIDERSALEGITIRDDLSAIASAQFVYEAIPEILSEKQRLFSELEAFIDDHVPIVSGTSTFFPDKLGFYLMIR